MATLVNFNNIHKILLTKKRELFIDLASQDWIITANKSIQQNNAFYVALSGGSTPLAIFENIIENKEKLLYPSRIFLFWGDERNVPPTSKDSNYGQAMSLLGELNIPEDHVFRMPVEDPEGDSKYQEIIETVIPQASFDMIMLGVGEDGHTLSLFPNTQAVQENTRLVVFNDVPQLNTKRMTLTLPIVRKAKHIVVYVQGENKKKIIKTLFSQSRDRVSPYPIEMISQGESPLFWILSPDAYELSDFDSISSLHKLDIV
ncbi:6-phosphogluconolactonase [Chlamydia avium]|uniref:6-phosphogluconolactonase n=1 Tax=Chlamydia avium 10DC88 TaxID=1229831 RepID=W8JF99_9CHLA|nr:6-phosphogluconolactonase [Chlamydia avium]AHK63216.1 6-phosphogluconolactonase [Chlamydia avium 10DC88]